MQRWMVGVWMALLSTCGLLSAAEPSQAQDLTPQQVDVYTSGQEGYHTYRIPSVVVTHRGAVLAFCEGRKLGRGDSGDIDLLLRRSTDGGRTFSKQQVVWDDAANTCGNPCAVVDRTTGTIWLLLTRNLGTDREKEIIARKSKGSRTVWLAKSSDDGLTWSNPVEITNVAKRPDWTWYATGPGSGIQLRSGRLVIPCDHIEAETNLYFSHVLYSDDHGASWKLGGSAGPATNECEVVELADGSLMLNMRNYDRKQHARAVSRSTDGGLTWSPVVHDAALVEPICQASIHRHSLAGDGGKNRIVFSNPGEAAARKEMTLRLSHDEGKTWPVGKVLWPGPAAYSSLAVLKDGTILCLYERGLKSAYETITLARVTLEWLGEQSVAKTKWLNQGAGDRTPIDAKPIVLHPENGHYFLWRGKPTILVTSGEHYGAVLNLDFDYVRYLDALAADGLNHTRTFSGTYREVPASFGITDNPLAPKPGRYLCPWARSNQPGCSDGGNKFDLTRWDPAYFQRLRQFMAAAGARGIVVEMNLFCPLYKDELWTASPMAAGNNTNGVGDCPRTEVLTLKHPKLLEVQIALTRKIVAELNEFDNLYFEVCNEPYFGGVTQEWQDRIADAIIETERPLPRKHLIAMNIANGRKKVERPHPAVSILNFHYCVPPDAVAMNFALDRVIGENETGFRGKDDFLYRSEAWDFLLAGGGLYNNLDYSFTPSHPDGTLREYRSPGGGSLELRKQLAILKRFLEGFDFVRMKPDASVLKSVSGGLAAQALVEPGRAYAIYLHVPLPNKPKNLAEHLRRGVRATIAVDLPRGPYLAEWLDTKTGHIARGETFEHSGGVKSLSSPEFDNDIALRIVRAAESQ